MGRERTRDLRRSGAAAPGEKFVSPHRTSQRPTDRPTDRHGGTHAECLDEIVFYKLPLLNILFAKFWRAGAPGERASQRALRMSGA